MPRVGTMPVPRRVPAMPKLFTPAVVVVSLVCAVTARPTKTVLENTLARPPQGVQSKPFVP